MMPTTRTLNKYHDKKRRIEYIKITNMIKQEEDANNGVAPAKPKPRLSIQNRILENLNFEDDSKKLLQGIDDLEESLRKA